MFIPSGHRKQLVSGDQKFADIASTESDCNSSKKGGDLGPFGRGSMQSESCDHDDKYLLLCVLVVLYRTI